MKKKLLLFSIFCIILGVCSFSVAKEEYTNLADPINKISNHAELTVNRQYPMLTSTTQDFNGMDYSVYKLNCRGESYLKGEDNVTYAKTGSGGFMSHTSGEYVKMEHNGVERSNYSKLHAGWTYTCRETVWDPDEEEEVLCIKHGTTWEETRYKAYTQDVFENTIRPYNDSSWCQHARSNYQSFVGGYEGEQIRNSGVSKVTYYVYGGMPVNIPVFTLLTSIEPFTQDLWVDIYSADGEKGKYNAGVFQLFDSTNPHIKHTASSMTEEESELIKTVETFEDVELSSLGGLMYYHDLTITGDTKRFFISCNECSTCERCESGKYGALNTYVAYGEIPEFYLSRGCQMHSCCFVYDYPVVLPDEFEGVKCPELKIEGDKYPACEQHTCNRWLEHSDYRENFAPQTCLRVVAGTTITGTESGIRQVRYTGPVDQGLMEIRANARIVNGGYSEYCANHMCNAFFCDNSREDSEAYSVKYSKTKNEVYMPNRYCSEHKYGCKVVSNYSTQPRESNGGLTIVEQIRRDQIQGKFKLCNKVVTQTFYGFIQPDALICEDCYDIMSQGELKESGPNKNLNITSKCANCGSSGVSLFRTVEGYYWCATCVDFNNYSVVHRNISNYNSSYVQGYPRENTCVFKVQRFAGDNAALCGERCVKNRRYCHWHLCDTENCANPVKYNGTYFCKECNPDVEYFGGSVLAQSSEPVFNDEEEITDISEYDQITPEELRELINSGNGISYEYRGKTISLTNRQALILLNKIDGECSYTPELATAVGQVLLNNHLYCNKNMETVLTGTTSYAAVKTTKNYSDNALLGLANIINNNSTSNEVSAIIGNSVLFAGDIDEKTNYNNAMASYVQNGTAFLTEGTVLGNPPGAITVFGLNEAFPSKCGSCGRYVGIDGRCSCGN